MLLILVGLFMIAPVYADISSDYSMGQEVLTYWFGTLTFPEDEPSKEKRHAWFSGDPNVDQEIKRRFEPLLRQAGEQELDPWVTTPRGRLALIIVLDQFSRNIYRGTPEAFAFDTMSLKLAKEGIEREDDHLLFPIERIFFYLPFMHAEDREDQKLSVILYEKLLAEAPEKLKERFTASLNYAIRHEEIIERFGRFPHRNAILGREPTPDELEFLTQPGSSF